MSHHFQLFRAITDPIQMNHVFINSDGVYFSGGAVYFSGGGGGRGGRGGRGGGGGRGGFHGAGGWRRSRKAAREERRRLQYRLEQIDQWLLDNPAPTGNGQSESTHGDSLLVGQAQSGGPVIQYPQGDDPGRQARDEGPGIGGSRGGGSVMRCRRGGGPVIRYTHGDDPVDRQAQGDSPGIGGIRDGGPVTRRPQDDGSEWEVNPFTELPAREEENNPDKRE